MRSKILILVIFLFSANLYAQPLKIVRPKPKELPKFEISLDYRMSNTSIFYDSTGNSVSRIQDTVPIFENDSIIGYKKYTFQLSRYYFIPNFKWRASENLLINANLVLVQSSYNEKYTFDSTYRQADKADFNMFQVESFNLAGEYSLLTGKTYLAAIAALSIPFGFYRGQNDPDYNFLDDGAFELFAQLKYRQTLDKMNIELASAYNWRDEDLKSRFIFNSKLGLISVPGTELSVFANYFLPLGDNKKLPPFNTRRRALNEETLQVGAAFRILFDNNFFMQTGYDINIAGKNSFGTGTFSFNVGYRF